MKKIFAAVFALFITVTGLFAANVNFPKGAWIDENWDARWVFDVEKVQLYLDSTDELIFTFTKENTKDFKLTPSAEGITLSFRCDETHRFYRFTKPFSSDSDFMMFIDPDWTDVDYLVRLNFKSLDF